MQNYSEKVMEHFRNPRNVGVIENPDGVGHVGNPVCLLPGELVYTNPGIKKIREISENDYVLSHDGKYHKVNKIYRRQYRGKIYSLSINNLGTISLTPEHHVLALKLGKRNKFASYKKFIPDWYSAEELEKGDFILYPIPRETLNVKKIKFDLEKPKWDFKSKELPEEIKISDDFLRLIGYYLAEGYVRIEPSKGTLGFVFWSKEDAYIEEVINSVQNLFKINPARVQTRHNARQILFYSARLARFFAQNFGKSALNKHMPHWMMLLPVEKQRSILSGLLRGDGYIDLKRQRIKFVTISKQLAYQLRLLLLRQGIISNFSIGKADGIHKQSYLFYIQDDTSLEKLSQIIGIDREIKRKKKNIHKCWFDDKFFYTSIREINSSPYRGWVYNLNVEGSYSYVSNALSLHNCGDIMELYIKVEDGVIVDAKFKTFGCGAAIATSSMVTELVKGKTIEEALKISNRAVAEALGGLPPIKMHCSVLAEEALKSAIEDYYKKHPKK